MITYTYDLLKSFPLGKMSFHQCLSSYYKDISVAIIIKEFHQVKVIKPTVIITYNCDLFESFTLGRMSFQQLLTKYYKDIGVAASEREFQQNKDAKPRVMITYYCELFESFPLREDIITPNLQKVLRGYKCSYHYNRVSPH